MALPVPKTVGELFNLVQNNGLLGYSQGAQMAMASAITGLFQDPTSGINSDTVLAHEFALNAIYKKLHDERLLFSQHIVWDLLSPGGSSTEEAMHFIDHFMR